MKIVSKIVFREKINHKKPSEQIVTKIVLVDAFTLSMYLSLAFKLSASEFPDQFVHLLRVRYSVHLIQHQDGGNSRVSDQEVEYPFRNGLADEPIRHVMYHTD